MKVTNFTFSDNRLVVYFDVDFKQINYIKMESIGNDYTLECEEMEIKYSKKKNTLNLFVHNGSKIVVLLITIFDNKDVCYAYYMTRQINANIGEKEDNMDMMTRGFTQLFKNGFGENNQSNIEKPSTIPLQTSTSENAVKVCPIKNQNIFANIKKKV